MKRFVLECCMTSCDSQQDREDLEAIAVGDRL